MKVGQLFALPSHRPVGYVGKLFNSDQTKVIAKYEVIEIEKEVRLDKLNDKDELIELVKECKGRLIVVYKSEGRYKCKPKS